MEVLWQIGVRDGKSWEFGLAPDGARRFAEAFGERVIFAVGETPLSRFPFIHPSSADIAWGKSPQVPFVLRFYLDHHPKGVYALVIALADAHEKLPSTMVVSVNGRAIWQGKMPLGAGKAFYGKEGKTFTFTVSVPPSALRRGRNEITLVLQDGSWVAYDALAFVRWQPRPLPDPPPLSPPPRSIALGAEAFFPEGVLVVGGEGFHAAGGIGDSLRLSLPLSGRGLQAQFSLAVVQGQVTLAFTVPGEGIRGDAWQITFARRDERLLLEPTETPLCRFFEPKAPVSLSPHSPWLNITVYQKEGRLSIRVFDGEKLAARLRGVYVPVPEGQWCWFCGADGTEWAVSHLRLIRREGAKAFPRPPQKRVLFHRLPSVPFAFINRHADEIVAGNGSLELRIAFQEGLNPYRLVDRQTGFCYADSDYCYGSPDAPFPRCLEPPQIVRHERGDIEVLLKGRQGALQIEHRFLILKDAIEEKLIVTNLGEEPVSLEGRGFGFTKTLFNGKEWFADSQGCRFVAIPYRREPETGTFWDFEVAELAWRRGWFWVANYPGVPGMQRFWGDAFGSEGWAWVMAGGHRALLIAKHNPEAMEWSLLEPLWVGEKLKLRFGGAGLWKLGDPEPAATLRPGEGFSFGVTRYSVCRDGWKGAFYAFRDWMKELGHDLPQGYNPPIHWNELYDNPYWWGPRTKERREKFYGLEDMLGEAEKATELGCEALYLDPGWDTTFASSVWDEGRLGSQKSFVRLIRKRFGLRLALHTPLAGWCDINAYPLSARRRDPSGRILPSLCSAAPDYLKVKERRLLTLCRDGASFLMLNGSAYTGECYEKGHGHPIPLTRHEHCQAYLRLIQAIKKRFPRVLIELHDPIVAGVRTRYAPTYFLHALPHSPDELWGYEFMWDPMEDLLSGRAISLYYVNLAYRLPIYLHIDLRKDNEHALMFWWYASTCRHLGVGGKHPDPRVWAAHKGAMRVYRRLKKFFVQGQFYGLDETVHAHTLWEGHLEGAIVSVLNIFNLSGMELDREIRFRLPDIGLPPDLPVRFTDVPFYQEGDEITLWVRLPPLGHRVIEVQLKVGEGKR